MFFMIAKHSEQKEKEEVCMMCQRVKRKHSPEELHACSKKMEEFRKQPKGGAGIQ
jgi:hypothetical protein